MLKTKVSKFLTLKFPLKRLENLPKKSFKITGFFLSNPLDKEFIKNIGFIDYS